MRYAALHLSPKVNIIRVISPNAMDNEVELDKKNQRIWSQKMAECPNAIEASVVRRKTNPN